MLDEGRGGLVADRLLDSDYPPEAGRLTSTNHGEPMRQPTPDPPSQRRLFLRNAVLAALLLGLAGLAVLGVLRAERPGPTLDAILGLARQRQFHRAMDRLEVYLGSHPDDRTAHLLMGQLATEPPEPRPRVALEHLAAVRPKDSTEAARVRFFEGKARYQEGRYDLAESAWSDALKLDPLVPEAGWALIDLLDKEGRLREAHRLGMRLYQLEPDPIDRARILLDMTRLDIDVVSPGSQVLLFGPLAKEHPENLHLSLTVGLALVRDSRGAEGLKVLEAAIARFPDSPDAWDAWLTGLDGAFQAHRLMEEFARLPRSLADDPRFAVHEGIVAQNLGDWPRAIRAFRRAAAHEPYNGILTYRLRAALRLAGDRAEFQRVNRWYVSFEDAFRTVRAVYNEALATPTLGTAPHPELYHRLADLRERMGRPDEARAWHSLVLRDDPGDPVSQAALKRLE